jgi:PKHD-type hydroxylase
VKAWHLHQAALFSPAECDAITAHATAQTGEHDALVLSGGEFVVNPAMRRSKVRWLDRNDAQLSSIFYRLQTFTEKANAEVFGFDLRTFPKLQFAEYRSSEEGHFDWHIDNNWTGNNEMGRKLSVVVMLSNPADFEGGTFELNQGAPALAQGDVVAFPSFHRHRVTPVTRGIRRSMAAWFHGPPFK